MKHDKVCSRWQPPAAIDLHENQNTPIVMQWRSPKRRLRWRPNSHRMCPRLWLYQESYAIWRYRTWLVGWKCVDIRPWVYWNNIRHTGCLYWAMHMIHNAAHPGLHLRLYGSHETLGFPIERLGVHARRRMRGHVDGLRLTWVAAREGVFRGSDEARNTHLWLSGHYVAVRIS